MEVDIQALEREKDELEAKLKKVLSAPFPWVHIKTENVL